jgi:hypothetical protein
VPGTGLEQLAQSQASEQSDKLGLTTYAPKNIPKMACYFGSVTG